MVLFLSFVFCMNAYSHPLNHSYRVKSWYRIVITSVNADLKIMRKVIIFDGLCMHLFMGNKCKREKEESEKYALIEQPVLNIAFL